MLCDQNTKKKKGDNITNYGFVIAFLHLIYIYLLRSNISTLIAGYDL